MLGERRLTNDHMVGQNIKSDSNTNQSQNIEVVVDA